MEFPGPMEKSSVTWHVYNPTTGEEETGESLGLGG